MIILLVLALGVLIGARIVPVRFKKWIERLQTIFIAILIFAMGISLGSRENFIEELMTLGISSLVLAIIPMFLSAYFVYILTKYFFKDKQ